jgi:predicted dehydrogenase
MYTVKIYGAGSIGNHLANAFRHREFDVILTDIDNRALERAKNEIYPSRYGSWDLNIQLELSKNVISLKTDIVFIGTPPEFHIEIALKELENMPKLILIEKPLSEPSMKGLFDLYMKSKNSKTKILIGYNHVVSAASLKLESLISESFLGKIESISSYTREHWGGIFKAHPWLDGPKDSYLGFTHKGGGALCEHSHGLNYWQYISYLTGSGRIDEVNADINFFKDSFLHYDKTAIVSIKTENGVYGDLIQDVITFPTEKYSKIQGDAGFIKISLSKNNSDIIEFGDLNEMKEILIPKNRPDDFIWEVDHIISILGNKIKESPIDICRGIETMLVIDSIFESNRTKKPVKIDYSKLN